MSLNKREQRGYIFSALFHIGLGLVAYFGLPRLLDDRVMEQSAITVEILPVSELTNVRPKPTAPKVKPKPEPKKVTAAEKPKLSLPDPTPKPVLSEPKPKPPAPKPEPKQAAKPAPKEKAPLPPEAKKPEEKKEAKKQEPVEDAFAAVLKSVEAMDAVEEAKEGEKEVDFSELEDALSGKTQQEYKAFLPLSLSEKDAIRQQIMRNWTVMGGARDAQNMVVTLKLSLAQDGTVSNVEIVDKLRYGSDTFFRAMVDSAVRAVYKSSPIQGLPAEKYDTRDGWKELELRFDPSEMLY